MLISTKGRYALRIMLELARHTDGEYIPLKQITQNQGISIKYAESILSALSREGIIEGVKGKGGGYRLAKPAENYSVGEILRISDSSLAPVSCLECDENTCPRAADCPTLPMWEKLNSLICGYLDGITLKDLQEKKI